MATPLAAQSVCDADIDRDGLVNAADLGLLLAAWGPAASAGDAADLTGDGVVGGADLTSLLVSWSVLSRPLATPDWATVIEAEPDPAVVTDPALRCAIRASGLAWRVSDKSTQIEMLLIPPGQFEMGCSPSLASDCWLGEAPRHAVVLSRPFYMGRYEVTRGQWEQVLGVPPGGEAAGTRADHPVEQVAEQDLARFLAATGMRLPTEAEWEYSCRAGTQTAYHGMPAAPEGTDDDALLVHIAWHAANNGPSGSPTYGSKPVGLLAANALGLHDMLGNATEATSDWMQSNFYAVSPLQDPVGPGYGSYRVARGGGWSSEASNGELRASNRNSGLDGFRVVRDAGGFASPRLFSISPVGGPPAGGTRVTIRGRWLEQVDSVTIGGVPASEVTLVDGETLSALVPAGNAGAADVVVVTPGGSATKVGGFTYATTWYTVLQAAPPASVVTSAALRAAILDTGLPWRVRDNATQIEMLLVPPGSFVMGCSASSQSGCGADELPVRTVTLTQPFYLGRYEVTQAQWASVMGGNYSLFQSVGDPDSPLRPVERASGTWVDRFLEATGFRLPTEAEWEFACRAGTTTAYHGATGFPQGTNDESLLPTIGWFSANAKGSTQPVGQLAANTLGFHDMLGNVREWVSDWYDEHYYAWREDVDPVGPSGWYTWRSMRGGTYSGAAAQLRVSNRDSFAPSADAYQYHGLRVARAP